MRSFLILNGHRYKLCMHARRRLQERFNLSELPAGSPDVVCKLTGTRSMWKLANVYFITSSSTLKIVTVFTVKYARQRYFIKRINREVKSNGMEAKTEEGRSVQTGTV